MAKKHQPMRKRTPTRSLSVKMRREQLKYSTRQSNRANLRGQKKLQDIDLSIPLNIVKRNNQEVPEVNNTSTNEITKMRKVDRKGDENFDMQNQLTPFNSTVNQKDQELELSNKTDHQECEVPLGYRTAVDYT